MQDEGRAILYALGLAVINLGAYVLQADETLTTLVTIVLDTALVALFFFWKGGQGTTTPMMRLDDTETTEPYDGGGPRIRGRRD